LLWERKIFNFPFNDFKSLWENCEGGGGAKKRSTPLRDKITFLWGLAGCKRSTEKDSEQYYLS